MILVTGGAGLLGSELIRQLLSQGKKVRAIYNKSLLPDFNSELLEQFQCNILDVVGLETAMQGVQEVYHCAAVVSFAPSSKRELFSINIEGTANVVNAALDAGIKKMVHVSSVAALGRIREGEPITENMNWTEETSNSVYGQSKYLGELEVWRGIGEGLNAVIVNPVIILGCADWKSGSAQIFKSVYDEFPWYTEGVSGFVDTGDVAKAMIALMQSDISNERFIISAENRTYRQVFNWIADGFGKRRPHKKVTTLIAKIVWRLEAIKSRLSGKKPLVTKETATTALAEVTYNNEKLLKFLPDFKYTNIESAILITCKQMLQNLKKR
jgi:nucleoside-diphosphate-sugar epimerase